MLHITEPNCRLPIARAGFLEKKTHSECFFSLHFNLVYTFLMYL